MPVSFDIDHTLGLRVWRMRGQVTQQEFADEFRRVMAQGSFSGEFPMLVIVEEDTDMSRLDRDALAEIAADALRNWRALAVKTQVRGAILCPGAMHRIVGRLFVSETESHRDYPVHYQVLATAVECETWLERDLSGIALPAYAELPLDDSLAC